MKKPQFVIAGASGFVGTALIARIFLDYPEATITALSRSERPSEDPRLTWKSCDLFCEESIALALPPEIDIVYYLVHSMGPTAKLDQGSFADYDLLMADKFAEACAEKGVKQLLYLGGLEPEGDKLSLHLQSRLEIEDVFKSHGIPHTFFRAGLILGKGGSSFQILLKLVKRLHVMICPAWTQTLTSPVDLPSVLNALVEATKDKEHLYRTYDLAGCRPLTYLEMMRQTAQFLQLKRFFVTVPFFSVTLSRLWVSLVTNTSRTLVYPLVESLKHPMVARDANLFSQECRSLSYLELLKNVSTQVKSRPFRFRLGQTRKTVRSIQRFPASGTTVESIAESYFDWLPKFTLRLISVSKTGDVIHLRLLRRVTLIELRLCQTQVTNKVIYFIVGGALVRKQHRSRLEFRLVLDGKFLLVAIHDYAPALPWFVYKYTQAKLHLMVMEAFGRYRGQRADLAKA